MLFSHTQSLSKSFVVVFLIWLFNPNSITGAAPSYRYHICTNATTYTPNSTFQSNLNLLLSSLSSNATAVNGFYNTTAGFDAPDIAYGMFLCRGDIAATNDCQECVAVAAQQVVQQYCPNQIGAIVWYDECTLRYANRTFFSIMEQSPVGYLWNPFNITEQDRFEQLLGVTVEDLVTRARDDESGNVRRFATGKVNFTAFEYIFSLAQCTPDISGSECYRCLGEAIKYFPTCCDGKKGGRVLLPSCNIRFEVVPFYNYINTAPPPTPMLISHPPPAPTPLTSPAGKGKISSQTIVAIVASTAVSVVSLSLGCCFLVRRARKQYDALEEKNGGNEIQTVHSLQFDLATIETATNNFSIDYKIGEGGFGPVYKGTLPNGQEIAVKRLSKSSGQGAIEFKNEVLVVAKLQHRNLVRLMGFCLAGEEKILIYEYVHNKSLDYFLFDPEKRRQLNWSRRYNIIGGIARGILYLHEDSQLRIIHRDLKASNILLDKDMNPKISDFGTAKIFGVDQSRGNTNRIIGTFGYMSPEYVMRGQFSVKSDVFSFGVLVLEIISGKKNSDLYQSDSDSVEGLLSYAWKHWRNGTPLELMDSTLKDSHSRNEVVRCIHIGLLCVEEDMEARPSMASISLMLNSLSVSLPLPRKPAFFGHSRTKYLSAPNAFESNERTRKSREWSLNEVSISELDPR